MTDKFYVYRPLLDLIGFTEGTDKGDGYNETLAYGKMADGIRTKGKGKDVALVDMTLKELDAFQTLMLRDPDNNWKSSACGRYQIVRTTARNIRKVLPDQYPADRKFDAACQDEMACYLLGARGIDKYLAGRMKEDTLINNLAKEWASFPTTANKGHYGGQHAAVKASRVREVLAEVRKRHAEGQPKEIVKVDHPVVPEKVEKEVRQKTNWLTSIFGAGGALAGLGSWLSGMDTEKLLIVAGFAIAGVLVILLFGEWLVRRVRSIRKAVADA